MLPTGKRSARKIIGMIPEHAKVIVEYGPGTGPISQAIVREGKLNDDGMLILIEKSPKMAAYLRRKFLGDPRIRVFCDSAENVGNILRQCDATHADCILASIPFSVIPDAVRTSIMRATRDALGHDGVFIVFLYKKRVGKYLRETFSDVMEESYFKRASPLRVFVARA